MDRSRVGGSSVFPKDGNGNGLEGEGSCTVRDISLKCCHALKKATETTDRSKRSYGNLGFVLSSRGKIAEAEWAFRMALKYRSNMADVHYNL
ncbi:uncharacterized protein GBIM_01273 [Gryllus bimaculatus]|nr:uncharacterized protein GBIM_01273 [Gryllus bimaculatus]